MTRSFRAARLCRSPLAGLALVVLCLAAHWPGALVLPPVDRDESRFAQAMRQVADAARSGDWEHTIVPHIQDRPRVNKPPLVYWLAIPGSLTLDDPANDLAGPGHLPTGNIFAYRLVSLLSAMLAVLLTWRAGLALRFHPAAAFLGACLLATCLLVSWDARQARADQTLLTCTTGAMLCLAHIWRRRELPMRRTLPFALGLAWWLALGVLAKGVALLFVGLAVLSLVLWNRPGRGIDFLRHVRPARVGFLAALPLAVWLLASRFILESHEATAAAARETIWRALIPQESHWGPPGYHLLLLPILFFPGCLVTGPALARLFRHGWTSAARPTLAARLRSVLIGPLRADDRTLFCLAWILLPWIAFELAMTKLPHYVLPVYPAIALITARHMLRMRAQHIRLPRVGLAVYLAMAALLCVGVPVALAASRSAPPVGLIHVALPGLIALPFVFRAARARRPIEAVAWTSLASMGVIALICHRMLPTHPDLWVSSRLMQAMHDAPHGDIQRPVAAVGYGEDSLIFLARGGVERMGPNRADEWFTRIPCGRAFVRDGAWTFDPQKFRLLATISGWNYSTGDRVTVHVIEATISMDDLPPGYDPSHFHTFPTHPK